MLWIIPGVVLAHRRHQEQLMLTEHGVNSVSTHGRLVRKWRIKIHKCKLSQERTETVTDEIVSDGRVWH